MSELKDRHVCGECKMFDDCIHVCWEHSNALIEPGEWEYVEPDDEACSDFKPKHGWRE